MLEYISLWSGTVRCLAKCSLHRYNYALLILTCLLTGEVYWGIILMVTYCHLPLHNFTIIIMNYFTTEQSFYFIRKTQQKVKRIFLAIVYNFVVIFNISELFDTEMQTNNHSCHKLTLCVSLCVAEVFKSWFFQICDCVEQVGYLTIKLYLF